MSIKFAVAIFQSIMDKKRDGKSDRNKDGLNKLSRLMLDQNESLRKLLEEISRKEKENDKKMQTQIKFNTAGNQHKNKSGVEELLFKP